MTDGNLGLADIQHFTTRWNLLMYYNNTYKRSFCSVFCRDPTQWGEMLTESIVTTGTYMLGGSKSQDFDIYLR